MRRDRKRREGTDRNLGGFDLYNVWSALTPMAGNGTGVLVAAGVYLTIVMAMTSLSVITAVFVLSLHHRGADRRSPAALTGAHCRPAYDACSLDGHLPAASRCYVTVTLHVTITLHVTQRRVSCATAATGR